MQSVCGLCGAVSIILSAGGAETIILLSEGGTESMMLSACAERMIVSVPTAASIILSAPFDHVITLSTITLSGGGQQKNNNWQY